MRSVRQLIRNGRRSPGAGVSLRAYAGMPYGRLRRMGRVLYTLVLVVVVVSVDLLFFRNRFWERLMANVGIVLLFAAFYLRFFKRT